MIAKHRHIILKVLVILFWTGMGTGFIVLFSSAMGKQKNIRVSSVHIDIDESKGIYFIGKDDVLGMIAQAHDGGIVGKPLAKVNLHQVETALKANPYIESVEVFATLKGAVNISISQREPIIRVINNNRVSYYIDKKGFKIPVSTKFTARVPIVYGDIPADQAKVYKETDSTVAAGIYRLALFIDTSEFWKAQVAQVNVDELGDFEIVPVFGDQSILIGQPYQLAEKFSRGLIFYKEVLKNVDASQYRAVNVRYKDQIICIKKDSTYGTP
ncbi:MAG: hypothetical protein SFW35_09470 [Chitinophagales bacterium]|nr:hypothetical protein [Chitinophagales bacterium]